MGERIVLDLETQREFGEVDGRKPELLGVSVVGIYRYQPGSYEAFVEAELPRLAPLIQQAELLIGFNIKRFDLPVLSPYLPFSIAALPVLDILDDVVKQLGHRVSLDSIAQATLGRGKSGTGLEALKWFKEGRFDELTRYCLDDVKLTREVYEYGKRHGQLFAVSRYGSEKLVIPVFWPERKRDLASIVRLLKEACDKRLQVEIEYLSEHTGKGEPATLTRRVNLYHVQESSFEGFCAPHQDVRQFRTERVLDVKPTWQRYTIPADYIPAAAPE
ncbi:MAG: ribonuclease H-like domain-containing protein [Candidatus Omnitrophica bacterium]|nr:ribonuclease H-like domain-containing protein [Candidatus Omnitrophota bacterium]